MQPTAYSICVASNVSVCDNKNYRVMIHPTTNKVDILCFGLEAIDASALGLYDSINDTPEWVQERIAILMMTNGKPPTEPVDGVGHRIDSYTYWVYHK